MRQAKEVRRQMLAGLLFWFVIAGVALAIIATNRLAALGGLLAGTLVAAGLVFHMYHHLDIALDMDTRHAQSHTQVAAFQRIFIMGAVLVASMLLQEYIHPVGTVLGIFGVKMTALMNPLIRRLLQKYDKKSV